MDELKVEKKSLSSTSRRLISAQDERPTSQTAGYAAAVVLVTILGGIVVSDMAALVASMFVS